MARRIQQRRSRIHGNGVFAVADIPAGTRLVEYRGLRRLHADADALYGDDLETGHTFLFTLNDEYLIDANEGGNVARWINHSCAPNCQAVLEEADGTDRSADRVFIEALRDIVAGEELAYNYGIRLSVPHTALLKRQWACRCGAEKCSGTMLQPKR
ncbi:MAG: SET domain-containing protein-lysine N-methyltransferase [Aquimonas sp.]|nr:SET domain-containing protein-lysine N-methyltransferase [Aquimonas sp.]